MDGRAEITSDGRNSVDEALSVASASTMDYEANEDELLCEYLNWGNQKMY